MMVLFFFCSRITISVQLEYMNKEYKQCWFIPIVIWSQCNIYIICNIFAIHHYYSIVPNHTYMYRALCNNEDIIILPTSALSANTHRL